jgi:2-dehydro-3-deoxygalactonokinase
VVDTHLIGLDWGTTQLRAYRFVAGGDVAESRELAAGIRRVAAGGATAGFERAFEQACGDWWRASPASAILACGMIGSAQGWREAPYLDIPTSVDALGRALTEVSTLSGARLRIVPGLIERGPLPEVMRGEETQIAGAIDHGAEAPSGADAWIGLPGTHTKWARVRDRRIIRFHTFMTGEVFAALCEHTILGRTMRPPATPDHHAFDRGVAVARSQKARAGVLSTIFSARTLGLVGALPAEAQADYLSGLLIGHELVALEGLFECADPIGPAGSIPIAPVAAVSAIASAPIAPVAPVAPIAPIAPIVPIVLVGSDVLCQRYRRALAAFGHAAAIAPGATERGLWRVATSAGLVARSAPC